MRFPLFRAVALALALLPVAAAAAPDDAFDSPSQSQPVRVEKPFLSASSPKTAKAANKPEDRLWFIVSAKDAGERTKVSDCGIALEAIADDKVAGVGAPRALALMKETGLSFDASPLAERFVAQDFPSEDAAFHDYARTVAALKELAGRHSDLASVFSIGASLQGREVLALRINATEKGAAPSAKPGIVFMGTHHAREHLSTEVPLLLARHLLENAAKPDIAKLLKTRDIYFIPMVNPDGVELDIEGGSYHMHRKNARENADGSVGVDLNRNYDFYWGTGGASSEPGDETYRGPNGFSEPETRNIKAFVEARPNLKILLSYHTFSELILYPWGHSHSPIDDSTALKAYTGMATAMGGMTGYKPEQASDLYIASGDTTDWAWGTRGIYSFTFELTPKSMWGGGFYPGAGKINSTFANNIRPALYLIDLADNPLRAAPSQNSPTASVQTPVTGGIQ